MVPLILKAIRSVEERFNIQTVYACESGSRAWGFDSVDSDYDVRIIYVRSPLEYVRLSPPRDAFDYRFDDPEFKDLDVACWDIRKAAELFWKSNPPLIEWMGSPIVYQEDSYITPILRECASLYFDRKKSAYHYVSMAKGVWNEISDASEVKRKKYLYVLRPLACIRWLFQEYSIPPTRFFSVVNSIPWPNEVKKAIHLLVEEKQTGVELGVGPVDPVLHDFCRTEIESAWKIAENLPVRQGVSQEKLDAMISKTIFADMRFNGIRLS